MTRYLDDDGRGHLNWNETLNKGFDAVGMDVDAVKATANAVETELIAARSGNSSIDNRFTPLEDEVHLSRGDTASLNDRLNVLLNPDGTAKSPTPVSDLWTEETDSVHVSANNLFYIPGNKTAIYTFGRSLELTQSSQVIYKFVHRSEHDSSNNRTYIYVDDGITSELSKVRYGQQTQNAPSNGKRYGEILEFLINQHIKGDIKGSERKRKFVRTGTLTPDEISFPSDYRSGPTVLLKNIALLTNTDGSYKPHVYTSFSANAISVDSYGVIFGDSGMPYLLYTSSYLTDTGEIWRTHINPLHGDVRGDFTVGNTYRIDLFSTSDSSEDNQKDELDVVEYFTGGNALKFNTQASARYGLVYNGYYPSRNISNQWEIVIYQLHKVTTTITEISITIKNNSAYTFNLGSNSIFGTVANGINYALSGDPIPASQTGTLTATVSAGNLLSDIVVNNGSSGSNRISYEIKEIKINGNTQTLVNTYAGSSSYLSKELKTLSDYLSIGDFADFNAGYWLGNEWKSQLLGDAQERNGGIVLKLGNKSIGASNSTIVDKLEVRKLDGTWQIYTPSYPTNQGQFAGDIEKNTVLVDVNNSATSLGYSSAADMLAKAVVRVQYKKKSRVWHPAEDVANTLAVSEKVYLFGSTRGGGIPGILQDMVGTVPTSNSGTDTNWSRILTGTDNENNKNTGHSYYTESNPKYDEPNAVAVLFRLVVKDDYLWMEAHFKGLTRVDSDWGDNNRITNDGIDYVVTAKDDNGNVVKTGVVNWNTGILA